MNDAYLFVIERRFNDWSPVRLRIKCRMATNIGPGNTVPANGELNDKTQ